MFKISVFCALILFGCASAQADLGTGKTDAQSNKAAAQFRLQSLREYSLSQGISDGRNVRFKEIREKLAKQKAELDVIYQVSNLYLENGFLQPPIILTGQNLYQQVKDGKAIDWSQIRYQIIAPARFVTQHLDWYTYLVSDEDLLNNKPAEDPVMTARNPEEDAVMKTMYKNGFVEGESQVDMEVQARIKSLTTMITGMMNYHILREKNIVSAPVVSKLYTPTSGNKTQLTLVGNSMEVSQDAGFNLDASTYRAYLDQKNPWSGNPKPQIIH
jgi:uncharacterized protein YfiM (DUF2279 family)